MRTLLAVQMLLVAPVAAAGAASVPTGITNIGASVIIFMIAGAVLLTLVFRAAARRVNRYLAQRAGTVRIRRRLRARGKAVRSDFLLPGAYGGLARIDHAMLTPGGLLCLRVIHANGKVSGGENDPQWTVIDGASRQRFLNPLIQNEGRVRALRKALPDVPVTNLVVFTGKVTFASAPPSNVIPLATLDGYLKQYVFGPSRVANRDSVWKKLGAAILDDADARKDFEAQISFS